jgi:peptidoglycan hydrolase-like protein with peptidoglycan-binding domain
MPPAPTPIASWGHASLSTSCTTSTKPSPENPSEGRLPANDGTSRVLRLRTGGQSQEVSSPVRLRHALPRRHPAYGDGVLLETLAGHEGSSGTAVILLQRRLGGVRVDGTFGPTTKAKIVALQRARHLPVNGLVKRPEWRALGAGIGTYTPPIRGFMSSLFAST